MKKKFLSILLTGVLVLSMASCGNSNSNNQTTKSPENQTQTQMQGSENQTVGDNFTYPMEPVTLTINGSGDGGTKFYDDSLHPAWAKDIYMHKVMRDETGVTLEDVGGAAGSTTMSEQFLLMLASGELPDIMIAPWNAYQGGAAAAIDEGYIVDLMQYAEYIPNMLKYLDENSDVTAQVLTTDGRLAFAPFVKVDPIVEFGLVIRKDWLDELKMEEPKTIDELHDVLVAFKEKYNCPSPLTFESRW